MTDVAQIVKSNPGMLKSSTQYRSRECKQAAIIVPKTSMPRTSRGIPPCTMRLVLGENFFLEDDFSLLGNSVGVFDLERLEQRLAVLGQLDHARQNIDILV